MQFATRHVAFAALVLAGFAPALSDAQIVPSGANAPNVISTANGLPQVNVNRPSGSGGVSLNTYSQFDVSRSGAILNNSPVITGTQQAGQINGNPNFGANQAARIIVNQVNSSAASQINGMLEVAGQRAEVVIANGSGISVNGGGFLNTSRAVLTTGTPNFAPDGSLTGFNVTRGNITVQGAGLDGSTVDQVDLLARAVQINAEVYAGKNLNVITGANQIGHDSLAFTPIAGDGPAPAVSIDVSQLGGMYSGRIFLASNEYGVGVSNQGVIAAKAGDLTLQSNGLLSLAGKASASGNLAATAGVIQNSGTTYAQQSATLSASGTVTNSGMVAAQQNTTVNAASVNSTGTLAAGVNGDGSLVQTGDLNVSASGAVTATGRNVAGGDVSVSGAAVDLAGAISSANGALSLAANSGELNLSGATTTAGGALDARAAGTLTNDNGAMSSGGAQTITAGALSNRNGQILSGGPLTANVTGAVSNAAGTMQAAGALSANAGSLDNTAGHIASLNGDGLSVVTTGLLNNGAGGTIGGKGSVTAQAGQLANAGSITAVQSLIARAVQTLFNGGILAANGNTTVSAGTVLTSSGTIAAGQLASASATTIDNSAGAISANQIALHGTNLVNHGGTITQTGTGATTLDMTGTLDNSAGGTLQTNSTDLTLAPAALDNDGGTITHAGTGTLTIAPGNGAGSISNVRGTIITAGQIAAQAGSLNNATGGGLTIAGSNISANDVILAAKNQVNVINTTDTDSTRSSNSSSSASVGVQYTLGGGFGVSAAMSNAHGDANSDSSIQNASHVNGANSVTVISGGDTNIIGSQINGKQIAADVGGNLNIVSVQDVTNSAAHQSSTGGGFTISQGGGSVSFSAQNGHADSNYAGVNEQAGINAGDGGFNINVKGNTDLTGGVISSAADASNNSLTTGTLTFSDIQNQSHYSANSNGISAGVGIGNTGKATGPGSVSGTPGVTPMISQNENGDESATTRSAISAGAINVTNGAGQTQDVANLSRDTTNTNGTVAKTPDVNAILNQQADTMQAAQAAGQTVSQGIGAYADMKRDEALDAAKAAYKNGDLEGASAALADFDSWSEGGDARAGLHLAGGALIGGLGGGAFGAVGGAAGAAISSKLADQMKGLSDSVSGATGSSLIGNLAGNIASGLAGAAVGGTAGAAMASNVNLYNAANDKNDTEAKKEAQELKQALDKERAMLGQAGAKVPAGTQAATVPSTALAAGAAAAGNGAKATNTGKVIIDGKIGGQLEARGWTPQEVQAVVNEGPVGTTMDNRSAGKTPDGLSRNDPASVYGSKSGYVVVNDRTGEVVQASGKNDPGWIPDSRINWK
ncbi:colicin E5-related ribonuclease [Paraburkholderia youngii]|uniref:two-partner secretion domain-containing protein n=1 Tax=Paraburkholderia youngii TaxID=2782701 RepID=UPI003D1F8B85